jgi:hypothetical protein
MLGLVTKGLSAKKFGQKLSAAGNAFLSVASKDYLAAMVAISTFHCGDASFASTQARAGVLPGATHASQTLFMSAKLAMSESQIVAESNLALSVPAPESN